MVTDPPLAERQDILHTPELTQSLDHSQPRQRSTKSSEQDSSARVQVSLGTRNREFDVDLRKADWFGFRQRKQQYIKDLEARLELLESAPNEQLEQLRSGMKALLDENHELRTLLASLAGFVGEGLGSVLPKLQVELPGEPTPA